jgi:prepilin-type N-terminal cleavage/methylation domain-containing protein
MQKLMKRLHKNEKGFTLVELMVVVVIIGILVAIAVPIYNTVTARATAGAIEANIRTLQGAVMMYHASFDVYPDDIALLNSFVEGDVNGANGLGPSGVTYSFEEGTTAPPIVQASQASE